MKLAKTIIVFTAILIAGDFQTSAQQSTSPPTSAAGGSSIEQIWEGKWGGTWDGFADGPCSGGIEVTNVTATSADVVYSWGFCGSSVPGSASDSGAKIEDEKLIVRPFPELEMVYIHIDANTLKGEYFRRTGEIASGTFTRS